MVLQTASPCFDQAFIDALKSVTKVTRQLYLFSCHYLVLQSLGSIGSCCLGSPCLALFQLRVCGVRGVHRFFSSVGTQRACKSIGWDGIVLHLFYHPFDNFSFSHRSLYRTASFTHSRNNQVKYSHLTFLTLFTHPGVTPQEQGTMVGTRPDPDNRVIGWMCESARAELCIVLALQYPYQITFS